MRPSILMILGMVLLAFIAGLRIGSETSLEALLREPLSETGPLLAQALTIPDDAERTAQLLEIFDALGPDDLNEVDMTFERLMPFVDPVAVVLFGEWWAGFDPQAAFEATTRWPLNDPNVGLNAVLRAWARRDPVGARLAVEGIRQAPRREAAIRALAQGWSDYGDDTGLAEYLESMADGGGRQRAIQVLIASKVVRKGIDQTIAFAESLPDDSANRFKLQVYRRVATAVTQADPIRGATWALENRDGPFGDSLLRLVATSWVRQDPVTALVWLRDLPPGTQRDDALREGYRQWLMDDRAVALAWLRETGQSADLDPAFELFASATGFDDPQEGLDWAARIENPALRERATVNVARIWMAKDPEQATIWLAAVDLPEAWKDRIRTEARKRRAAAGLTR